MKISYGAVLPLPPDEAFEFVADPANWPLFSPGVRSVDTTRTGGESGATHGSPAQSLAVL
jgi:hypothetical protein